MTLRILAGGVQESTLTAMTRVLRRAASANATRAPGRMARTKCRKHKVIMESITQAKKKLRSVVRYPNSSSALDVNSAFEFYSRFHSRQKHHRVILLFPLATHSLPAPARRCAGGMD